MRRIGITLSLVLAAGIASGCMADSDLAGDDARDISQHPDFTADWAERSLPFGDHHDHRDRGQHLNLSTPNWEILGFDPLETDHYGGTAGDHFCGSTVSRAERRLSAVESFGSDVAFVLADTSDLRNPRKLGELVLTNTQVYDLTMTPDQRFVLLVTTPLDTGPDAPADGFTPWATWRNACTGQTTQVPLVESLVPWDPGLVMVSIEDPLRPEVVDFQPLPYWGHSVRAHEIDGRTLILVTLFSYVHETSYYAILGIEDLPVGPKLAAMSIISSVQPDGEVIVFREPTGSAHDGYIATHPITGEDLAFLANGPAGLLIYNVDDPRAPRFVSKWNDFGVLGDAQPSDSYFHTVIPAQETWDGMHYTFVGEECLTRRATMPSCLVYAFETSDPSDLRFVGAWTLPVDVQWSETFTFSTHEFDIHNRTLFISMYHGGVWAVDVSTPEALRQMPAVGVLIPDRDSPTAPASPRRSLAMQQVLRNYALDHRPSVGDLDVVAEDGTIVLFDGTAGLYTARFDASRPAPPPPPWPLGYNE